MAQVKTVCFFDCDGTLIPHAYRVGTFSQKVSERVSEAIGEYVAAGNLAFLSTARMPQVINESLRALPTSGMVCADGGYVERDGRPILDAPFDPDLMDELLHECFDLGLGCLLDARDGSFTIGGCPLNVVGDLPDLASVEDIHAAYPDLHVWKASLTDEDFARLARYSHVLDRCEHYAAGEGAHELTRLGVGKGSGARRLLATVEGTPEHVICFGDAGNDLPIFEICDVRVAMGDAAEEAKERATYVTGDVAHDGVAEGLEALRALWE